MREDRGPKATGDQMAKNAQGQAILEEILNGTQQKIVSPNKFGGRDIFDAVTGLGVRFDANGAMMGFLEP